jgi:hypothetical protein
MTLDMENLMLVLANLGGFGTKFIENIGPIFYRFFLSTYSSRRNEHIRLVMTLCDG